MPSLNHTHQYARSPMRKHGKVDKRRYYCQDPDCSHYIDKQMLLGKKSICNKCGREMILTREMLTRAKPVCIHCAETKAAKQARATVSIPEIADLFKTLSKSEEVGKDEDETSS